MGSLDFGVLFILGIGVFGGILGASLFQRFRIPQVVGYIAIGILIGQSGLQIVKQEDILALRSFNLFALGLIGFLVGGELHGHTFRTFKKQFFSILFGEGLGAFFLVAIGTGIVTWVFVRDLPAALAAGIVFGAIASATDPASTMDVLWEYRARGALTTTLVMIVALDDALAMTLYGLGTGVAEILTGGEAGIGHAVIKVAAELAGALALGFCLGMAVKLVLRRMWQREKTLSILLGAILLAIGIAAAVESDVILATITLGVTLRNLVPRRSKEIFSLVRNVSTPIYVIFFVLVGARLSVGRMPIWLWVIVAVYVAGRSLGKMAGAWFGARLAGAPPEVRRYCGMSLFAQGGVAVGLSIMASHHLGGVAVTEGMTLGDMVVFGVTATTLIVQFLGPAMVKLAVQKAGESGRSITEEDVIESWTGQDLMDEETPFFHEEEPLSRVFQVIPEYDMNAFPVVDRKGGLVGILTLESLREVLANQDTWGWLVVGDLMIPARQKIYASTRLGDALALMEQSGFDHIPLVRGPGDDTAVGVLDIRKVKRRVREEVLRRQKRSFFPTTESPSGRA